MMKSMSRPSVSMSASRPRALSSATRAAIGLRVTICVRPERNPRSPPGSDRRHDTTPSVAPNLGIAYASAGAGSPTVCLVHGTGGSSDVWMRQLEDLADLGHIVALDLPGHGRSGGTIPRRIEDAAAAVAGLLDALGITRVVIGGHSMGGAIALQFALSCRERPDGLILIGTGARLRVLPRLLDLLANHYHEGVSLLMTLAIGARAPAELRAALHRAT